MTTDQEIVTIALTTKTVSLKIVNFDTDVDVDDILKIDYSNILGELLTFPVIMNRIGLLKAEQEELVSKAKLDFEIYQAQMTEEKRKLLTSVDTDDKGKTKVSKPTIAEVDNAVLLDVKYRKKKEILFAHQKNLSYLDTLYWSAKDKSDKLNRLSEKIVPSEHEGDLITEVVNGVMIKVTRNITQPRISNY